MYTRASSETVRQKNKGVYSTMTISNVRIFLNTDPESKVKAIATALLNNKLLIQSVRIVESQDEANGESYLRVFYPDQRLAEDKYRRCVAPSEDFRKELDAAILDAYEQVVADPSENTVVLSQEEADFEVTGMNVYPIASEGDTPNPLLAKVVIQLDNELWLRGMLLVKLADGTRILRSPSRPTKDNRRISYFQFPDRALRDDLRDRAIDAYDALPDE